MRLICHRRTDMLELSANAMAKATAKPKPAEKKKEAPMGSFASLLETIAEVDTVPKEAKTSRVVTREQRNRVTYAITATWTLRLPMQEEGVRSAAKSYCACKLSEESS